MHKNFDPHPPPPPKKEEECIETELLENFLHQKYWTKSVIYEVINKNIIYAYNLHKLS